jgi:hypothetical protein
MDRKQRVLLMIEVRKAIKALIESAFDEIDEEIEKNTFQGRDYKIVKSSKVRLSIKSLRSSFTKRVEHIGKGYESE